MCRIYVLLLCFRYSLHRAIRGRDVLVVQCISTSWPNSELHWSVRLGKSWLTATRQRSPVRHVTCLTAWRGHLFKHFQQTLRITLHNWKFWCTCYLLESTPYWTACWRVASPIAFISGTAVCRHGPWRRGPLTISCTVVDRGKFMPPKQPPQWRIGLARFVAAPQTFSKMKATWNTEVCWLAATADRARPDCTTLGTCTHLLHSGFLHLLLRVTTAFVSASHVLCTYRHDFPNRVSHSLPF